MQYAFDLANFGPYADPRVLADLKTLLETGDVPATG